MNELIEKLKAAIDEDERIARWAIEVNDGVSHWGGLPGEIANVQGPLNIHTNRHDPDRVLRQVAAHRKILDEYVPYRDSWHSRGVGYALHRVVLMLAEVYGIEQ